jgi:hypothetical protein
MSQKVRAKYIVGFLSLTVMLSFLIINQKSISNNVIPLKDDQSDYQLVFSPKNILLEENFKISSTGLNSTHTRIFYNPDTQRVSVSWVDLFQPFTPAAISSVKFAIGNSSTSWGSTIDVASVTDTMLMGYNPTPDKNGTIHLIFDEFSVDNYDINDVPVENEISVQSKESVVSNSGNSTCPVTILGLDGLVHLVWIDTTDNVDGDLYYTNYNATDDSWSTPTTRITNGADVLTNSPPTLAFDENNTLHLIWVDNRASEQEIYYSYLDEGSSWTAEEKITTVAYAPINPKLTFDNSSKKLLLLFRDNGTSTNLYYSYAQAKQGAGLWSSPVVVNSYLAPNSDYDICADTVGNNILVFEQYASNRNTIYLRHKNSYTTSWGANQRISSIDKPAHDPSLTADLNGTFYFAYTEEYQSDTTEVYLAYGALDSDSDGLSDYDEINTYGTNPLDADSDDDLLPDGAEVNIYQTNPLSSDSDSDLMPDFYEVDYNFDPNNSTDASLDYDNDDLTNLEEYLEGTSPINPDSDGDTLSDGSEVNDYSTDPLDIDTDADNLPDNYEVQWGLDPTTWDDVTADPDGDGLATETEYYLGTNPILADTDGDGASDFDEYRYGTDPLDPEDFPDLRGGISDYQDLLIGLGVGFGVLAIFLGLSVLVARQFKPKDRSKRKALERDEKEFFTSQTEKGQKMNYETEEKEAIKSILEKRKDLPPPTIVTSEPTEVVVEEKPAESKVKPQEDVPSFEEIIKSKKDTMKETIVALKNYDKLLDEVLNKKMTSFTISTASREALAEFATDSQALLGEAKAIWISTILPLIKGYEEALHIDTLEAESIIDDCSATFDKILEILVNREMEIVDEEVKREEIRQLAHKAVDDQEEEPSEAEETEPDNKDDTEV